MTMTIKLEPANFRRYVQKIQGLTPKKQANEYTTIILLFLVVSLFSWYAIRPTIQTILLLKKEIEDYRMVNMQMEEKIGSLIEAQSLYDSIADRLPLLSEALPTDPKAVDVVRQLRNLANQTGASVSGISVSSVPITSENIDQDQAVRHENSSSSLRGSTNQKIVNIAYNVTLSGSFASLRSFITSMVSMRRIITIDSIGMAPNNEAFPVETGEMVLKLVLGVNAHYIGQ